MEIKCADGEKTTYPLADVKVCNKFILVVCDYATRYPEAMPLKSTIAEHMAEEFVNLFARVGIPQEILTIKGPTSCPVC